MVWVAPSFCAGGMSKLNAAGPVMRHRPAVAQSPLLMLNESAVGVPFVTMAGEPLKLAIDGAGTVVIVTSVEAFVLTEPVVPVTVRRHVLEAVAGATRIDPGLLMGIGVPDAGSTCATDPFPPVNEACKVANDPAVIVADPVAAKVWIAGGTAILIVPGSDTVSGLVAAFAKTKVKFNCVAPLGGVMGIAELAPEASVAIVAPVPSFTTAVVTAAPNVGAANVTRVACPEAITVGLIVKAPPVIDTGPVTPTLTFPGWPVPPVCTATPEWLVTWSV